MESREGGIENNNDEPTPGSPWRDTHTHQGHTHMGYHTTSALRSGLR